MPEKYDIICPVIENNQVAQRTYLMRLEAPEIARLARPGQFVMIQTSDEPGDNPLLRRPFSMHRVTQDGEIYILYRLAGVGTGLMSDKKKGDGLKVLGPLGNGFDLDMAGEEAFLVAGGMGLAPMWALGEALKARADLKMYYGVKTRAEAVDFVGGSSGPFENGHIIIVSEDGSIGEKGLITGPLTEALEKKPAPVFACGPKPMLAAIASLAAGAGVKAQVSLEERMACGLGICMSCSAETADSTRDERRYARVCREGPVFYAGEVKW